MNWQTIDNLAGFLAANGWRVSTAETMPTQRLCNRLLHNYREAITCVFFR
jgi:hypothetical protein